MGHGVGVRADAGRASASELLRPRDVEALVVWAFREELVKLEWLGLEARFSFGRMPARQNPYPSSTPFFDTLVPIDGGRRPPDVREPHPDAEIIGRAVKALNGAAIAAAIGANPRRLFSDMPALVQAEAPAALAHYLPRLEDQVANIVIRCARLAWRPAWHGPKGVEIPVLKVRRARNSSRPAWFVMADVPDPLSPGKTIRMEIDGRDPVTHRPREGAYHKYDFEPEPRLVIDERADYRAWRIAMAEVAAAVDGKLTRHQALPPAAEEWPWETPS